MPQLLKQSLRRAWYQLPESRMKDFVRMGCRWGALNPLRHPMLQEINQLSIEATGELEDGTRYLQLKQGPTFHNFGPQQTAVPSCTHAYLHRFLRNDLQRVLSKDSMDMAADIVCRYLYPHADPTIAPPYPHRERGTFHPQHRDCIEDIPDFSPVQKQNLIDRFRIRPGDVVLDIGSYIGYGAMRLGEQVGKDGMVISVEADHRNQAMFEKNIQENRIGNVHLVPRAIWSSRGQREIYWNDSQLNSLVDGIVLQGNTRTVETDSVDSIVQERELNEVSLISLTVNGAEIEALQGAEQTLRNFGPRLTIAGWYERDGVPMHREITARLGSYGYQTIVGPMEEFTVGQTVRVDAVRDRRGAIKNEPVPKSGSKRDYASRNPQRRAAVASCEESKAQAACFAFWWRSRRNRPSPDELCDADVLYGL